jgi:DNA-binding transcriptional ArsR family regulator
MQIILANPRGFCACVNMAIECVDRVLKEVGTPVYVFHEIVHNKHVVERFRAEGAVFVENLTEVPHGAQLLYSAHGVSPEIRRVAELLKQVSDPTRLQVLMLLSERERNVTELCTDLGSQSQPAVSHHLTLLRMSGLVSFRRDGKHNFYRVDSTLVRQLLDQLFTATGNGHKQLQFDGFALAYKNHK